MKQLLAIFLIGISCFVYSCAGKEISPSQETTTQPAETADAHYNLGVAYHQQGKLDSAIAEYKKVLEINPNYAEAHNNLGLAYHQQGKYDLAVESYNLAIAINPDFALAHYNLGVAYDRQGKYDLTIESYHKALAINPNYAEAHNNLGLAYHQQGKYEQAITHYKEFIRLARTNPALQRHIRQAERLIQTLKKKSKPLDE